SARDPAHPGDHSGPGCVVAVLAVEAVCGQGRDLQEGRSWVEEEIDTVTGEEFAACDVSFPGLFRAAQGRDRDPIAQLLGEGAVRRLVGGERGPGGVHRRTEHKSPAHGVLSWRGC